MQQIISRLLASSLIIFISLFTFTPALAAWIPPNEPPPNGNPSLPVNTGSVAQIRIGDLEIGAFAGNLGDLWVNGVGTFKSGMQLLGGGLRLGVNMVNGFPGGTPQAGYLLSSADSSGNAQWVATSTLGLGGGGGLSWPLLAPLGSASAPSYSFTGDTNTGLWSSAADTLNFSTGGTSRLSLTSSQLSSTVPWRGPAGTAAAPAISFSAFPNSGLFQPPSASSAIGFATNGTERMRISAVGNTTFNLPIYAPVGGGSAAPAYSFNTDADTGLYRPANDTLGLVTGTAERLRISSAGDVGIGTTAPGAKLEVAGQVKITGGSPGLGKVLTSDVTGLASWADPSGGSSQWTTNGSDIYYNTGNVGVGNTAPFNYHTRGDGGLEIARNGRPELVLNRTTAGSQAAASLNISTAKDFVVNLKNGASPSIDALSISPATGNVTFAGSRLSVGANNPFSYLQKGDKGIGVSSDRPEIVIANNTTARGASLNLNEAGNFVITTKYGANPSIDMLKIDESGNFIFKPMTAGSAGSNQCTASKEGALFINKASSGTSTICACLSNGGTTFAWEQLATGGSIGTCPN